MEYMYVYCNFSTQECWSVSLWSPDEKCVIGGSCNGRIVIWNLEDKSIYHQYVICICT